MRGLQSFLVSRVHVTDRQGPYYIGWVRQKESRPPGRRPPFLPILGEGGQGVEGSWPLMPIPCYSSTSITSSNRVAPELFSLIKFARTKTASFGAVPTTLTLIQSCVPVTVSERTSPL